MHKTEAVGNSASKPTVPAAVNAPGWFISGTVLDFGMMNTLVDELLQILALKSVAASRTSDAQVAGVIGPAVKGLESAAAGTGSYFVDDPIWTRFLLGTTNSQVKGTRSGCSTSSGCVSDGNNSEVVASDDCLAGLVTPSICTFIAASQKMGAEGDMSAVIASVCSDTNRAKATGAQSAILASRFTDDTKGASGAQSLHAASVDSDVSGTQAAAVATGGCVVSGDVAFAAAAGLSTVSGDEAAALASLTATVSGDRAAALATTNCEATQEHSAAIGSLNSRNKSNPRSVMLASRYCDSAASTVPPEGSVFGGWDAGTTYVEPSWRLESDGGHVRGKGTVASGGLDYAEWFPNGDGKAHLPGRILTRKGPRAHLAQPGDRILGVVSVTPSVLGGDDVLGWRGKWQCDEWGRPLTRAVEGGQARVLNPDYDPGRAQHSPRSERGTEHTCVGLLGQLRIAVDADVEADDDVVAGIDGVGTRMMPDDGRRRGASIECMAIEVPFDAAKGYAIALCLLR